MKKNKKIVITIKCRKLKESAFKIRKAYGKPKSVYPSGGTGQRYKNKFGEL